MSPFLRQLWTASAVLISMVGQGMVLSYPTSLMPAMTAANAEIHADLETASFIASAIGIGGFAGFIQSSFLMEQYGRRIAHGIAIIPGIIGWLLIFFANNTTSLLIGRIFCGAGAGATVVLGAVVLGEYSSPDNRGVFLNLKTVAVSIGGMLGHIAGNFCLWRTVALISLAPLFTALLITLTWTESPAWLASKGQFEKSEKIFIWLRGKDENSLKELKEMIQVQLERVNKFDKMSFKKKIQDFFKKFTRKDFLKPVFIIFLGTMLIEVSGRHIFPAFAFDIMAEITGSKNKSFYSTLGLDLIITISTSFSSVIVKMMNRRLLLFSTGFAAVAILASACLYLFLIARDLISKNYPWIPIGLFILFFILVNLGCTPIPLAFLGELMPLAHRGAGSAVSGMLMALALNVTFQIVPLLLIHCKVYGTFAILAACIAIILLILYFVLPETKDKTLQEIEDYFNDGKYKDSEEVKVKMIEDSNVKSLS